MEEKNFEKTSSLDRIVGNLSDEQKQAVFDRFKIRFETTDIAKINELEKEKTSEEKQILAEINMATNALRKKFGLPDFDIPEENMHLIRKEEWAAEGDTGVCLPELQQILLRERERNIHFLDTAFHEAVHFKSYNAIQQLADCDETANYRHGLRIWPRSTRSKEKPEPLPDGQSYFQDLNEAVTEELTRQYIMTQTENPLYAKDFAETKELKEEALKKGMFKTLLNPDIFSLYKREGDDAIHAEKFAYPAERLALYQIRNQIFQENRDTFQSTEEVLDVFARAMFTGNMFELSRLMEKTFGKGTMRAIGTP
ncbi:MAG: hypothetical protein WCT48_02655 [Candidatus Paceibacterota bacterium]